MLVELNVECKMGRIFSHQDTNKQNKLSYSKTDYLQVNITTQVYTTMHRNRGHINYVVFKQSSIAT